MHEKGGIPMNLRSIYKKYKRKKQLQTFAPYFSISPDTVLCDNFNLDLRAPQSGKEPLPWATAYTSGVAHS